MKNFLSFIVVAFLAFSSSVFAVEPIAKPAVPAPKAAGKAVSAAQQEPVNINTADAQALTKLKGVGSKKAEAIIAWRKANGEFKTVDQLTDVKGIGSSILEANRKNIRLQ